MARIKNAARATSAKQIEDDRLESSDEPIPLTDSGRPRLVKAPSPPDAEESFILPEKLELAPGSDEFQQGNHSPPPRPPG